jgi:L-ascorbate metabolism protein UlaG (beta-lactamase superfamily)
MSVVKRLLLLLLVVVLAAAGWLAYRFTARPTLAPYLPLALPQAPAEFTGLRVTFLGVASLLLNDGETAILTDGFFTRPAARDVFLGKIAPDRDIIARSLDRAGIRKLAAVIALHSHYDHVMDSPEVARRTEAVLVGSNSTANVGRGWGLAEDRLRVVHNGEVLRFGKFEVTVIKSVHFPHPLAMGEINEPLRPPVRANDYREGGSYQLLVRHGGRSLLISGSAGFVEGGLAGRHADVVYLAIGGMGGKDDAYRSAYWQETVRAVHAGRVIPIHWDDFTLPLDQSLVPVRLLFDDMDKSMEFLQQRGQADKVDVRLVMPWQAVDPFQGLGR